MEISRYLAMTAGEMESFSQPEGYRPAYMACHFSAYGTGLSNIPAQLPAGSILMLNDRMPICGHDPERIAGQLEQAVTALGCDSVLLDFQRAHIPETRLLCQILVETLPCPTGVSDLYASELSCPVFVSPVPPDARLEEYLVPWAGREIWLDMAPVAGQITVTENGSTTAALPFSPAPEDVFLDGQLHTHYRAAVSKEEIVFHLWRDEVQLMELLKDSPRLGITKTIGLYQQLIPGCSKGVQSSDAGL